MVARGWMVDGWIGNRRGGDMLMRCECDYDCDEGDDDDRSRSR